VQEVRGLGAGLDCRASGGAQLPQSFGGPVAGARGTDRVSGEGGSGGGFGVDAVGLAAVAAGAPIRSGDLPDLLTTRAEVTGESGPVAAGSFDGPDAAVPQLLRPSQQLSRSGAAAADAVLVQASPQAVDRDGDVDVLVGVDPDDHVVGFEGRADACHC
jgi:hypothetical protein